MTPGQQQQDELAGGHDRRALKLGDGSVVIASVSVRHYVRTPNQCYAYLQFRKGKTVTKYIGRVTSDNKSESIRLGWEILRSRNLVESFGWSWIVN